VSATRGTAGADDFDDGWDMSAALVDGRWVERSPRRAAVEPQARREAALMPWLAPLLPLPVAVPRIVRADPLVLRHDYLPGGACPGTDPAHGRAIGDFLRALHAVDPDEATAHGARDADSGYADAQAMRDLMHRDVLPLVPDDLRADATSLLERASVRAGGACVVHGDLGPAHILVSGERVTGVIDWGDSGVGDPAIDLAWTVHGAAPAFAEQVVSAYRPSAAVLARSFDLHLLGPWHEVLFGLQTEQDAFVRSGLDGVVTRLRRARAG
jgi:aminoglycoside phosphotransferase (APT) family kinase protein